ncbi:inositol monophosphatase family protein [Tautonia sociabilis]|uniref:Inositol phosphatase n=1 Tax=Tautonia sociabilis TaxID=2080755 RepID=A0A432MN42_9BACT|nr:inositol monophosphatase family protein [Tautonia sociabilis]RUL88861.1 inositol phosphatase [Tautonia sociabilis]
MSPASDPKSLQADLDLALRLAEHASEVILPKFRRCAVEIKPDGTEVTAADRSAEEVIRDVLGRERPGDGVLGEEFPERVAAEGISRQWIVDPIDGTAAFALGLPTFGTLIALMEGGEPVVGVIHLPAMGETTYAAIGLGCWWRPSPGEPAERVRVAPPTPLGEAYASTTNPRSSDIVSRPGQVRYRLGTLIRSAGKFRFVGDCVQFALVCRGRLHVAFDSMMAPWDIAALVPCIEEAGGVASALDGSRPGIVFSRSVLSSCDPELHREVLRVLTPDETDPE